ncbi:prolyl oligopeptidase family serine peptidase [Streptomyces sp. B1866]|uniref:S9 family peptidase n=1 Tax=Streptomyces sp. B1866 TaxID=3075431 RepID=UPI00288EA963|nr:prolyl oligopeptidase family serine peptidase [Streptomyces sp. B1866]MDT3397779.1 prolyl oligopeptidase family serine peptidase [Streptomyces sp. B1866]
MTRPETRPENGQLSFPRQHARTQRFSLGAPRSFSVSPDGARVVFLRSRTGTSRANLLWVYDTAERRAYVAADPDALLGGSDEELPPEERARRERAREGSAGVVGYALDEAGELAAFTLSGRLFTAELRAGTARELPAAGPVVDPRPSPDGRHVAYAAGGALRVTGADGSGDRALAGPEGPGVTYGLAEFIAAEEMDRYRGFWWSPDSTALLVARADDAPVRRWWIADPAHPDREPAEVAYPAAGTPNADVRLVLLGLDGARTEVAWDREGHPYLARVHWSAYGPPLLLVQSRDQREQRYLTVDTATGSTTVVHTETDAAWLELFSGAPAWTPSGELVRVVDIPAGADGADGGARVLVAGDRRLTTGALHVRAVLDVGAEDVLFSASPGAAAGLPDRPGEIGVYRVRYDGAAAPGGDGGPEPVTAGVPGPAVRSAARGGDVLVLASSVPDRPGAAVEVLRLGDADEVEGPEGKGREPVLVGRVDSYAEEPVITARPRLVFAGERAVPSAVLLPAGYREGDGPLPVLMDPYGGPHGPRVVAAHNAHLTSQWFADQGFAVVVADGRGTPGRSPGWEKAVAHRLAEVSLADQVAALHALAERFPLDLGRVGIRGWSYGGFLAALAVLRRPDVFHAGVVGAPVTDWRLYDTHYTERYLGDPGERPEVYAANSLVTDEGLSGAADLARPMMVVHGLADDNVVVAHSLRLSSALLAAGRPHEVLPLSGVTHMTPQEQVAENLLLLQVDFLKRSLGVR